MPLLLLIRHGIAHDDSPDGSDFARELTSKGRDKLTRQAAALGAMGLVPDRLVSSPLVRALQTAQILSEAWGVPVETNRALALGARPDDYLAAREGGGGGVACVGHNPDISHAVHALTGARVQMRKGMVAAVELAGASSREGMLAGLYDPDALARAAR
jgi:phosphohistidine phosphatase